VVSESRLVIKRDSAPFDSAVLFGCALPTGAGMVLNDLAPFSGSSVIVLGSGGVGLSALIALKALGVKMIIAVDIFEDKLALVKQLGATHAFNSKSGDFSQTILGLTNGGADICVELGGKLRRLSSGFR